MRKIVNNDPHHQKSAQQQQQQERESKGSNQSVDLRCRKKSVMREDTVWT
jgi:hypothetical protein